LQLELDNKPEVGVWKFWPTIGWGAVIFIIYSIVQFLVAFAFAVGLMISRPSLDPVQLLENLRTNGLLLSTAIIASAIVGLGFTYLFIRLRKGPSFAGYLGLRPLTKKMIFILLGVVIILLLMSFGLDQAFPNSQNAMFEVNVYKASVIPVLFWIAAVIFAPAFEESFFRGFLFVGLQQSRIGSVGAILLTAVAWAALHIQYDFYGMATVLVLGIVLGIVRLKTGSLLSTLLMHAAWNLASMISVALYVSGTGS
jgi:membrane protease YdiL (CAAX protease family)